MNADVKKYTIDLIGINKDVIAIESHQ